MNPSRILLLSVLALFAAPSAFSQVLGALLYSTRAGRAISLKVVDGGHPTLMSLRLEAGEAEAFRLFVLAHAGPEGAVAQWAYPLHEKAPIGWRVNGNRADALLKNPEATYWRYTADWVVPVRFRFKGQEWELLNAELPSRLFVAR